MNDLSWFLYLAGVLPDIASTVFNLGLISLTCISPLLALASTIDLKEGPFCKPVKWPVKIVGASVAAIFVSSFVPDSDTMYAIAASEIGEEVLESETGNKAVDALNSWLDDQIEGTTEGE